MTSEHRLKKIRIMVDARTKKLKAMGLCTACGKSKTKINAKTKQPQINCIKCAKTKNIRHKKLRGKPILSDDDPLIQMINKETGFFDAVKKMREAKIKIDMPIKTLDRFCQFNGVAIIYDGGLWRGIREEKYPEPTIYMSIKK